METVVIKNAIAQGLINRFHFEVSFQGDQKGGGEGAHRLGRAGQKCSVFSSGHQNQEYA